MGCHKMLTPTLNNLTRPNAGNATALGDGNTARSKSFQRVTVFADAWGGLSVKGTPQAHRNQPTGCAGIPASSNMSLHSNMDPRKQHEAKSNLLNGICNHDNP